MKKGKRFASFSLVAGLCLMLGFSAVGYLFHTNVGKLTVREVFYETQYGTLSGTVYKPSNATSASTPTPVIVLAHGYGESREKQSMAAIELSRRGSISHVVTVNANNVSTVTVTGSVVIAIDLYGHGHSKLKAGLSEKDPAKLLEMNAAGLWDAVSYVQNLPYANKAKVAIAGASSQSFDVLSEAVRLDNKQYDEAIAAGAAAVRRIAAVFYDGDMPEIYGIDFLRNRDVGVCSGQANVKDFLTKGSGQKFAVETNEEETTAAAAGKPVKNGFDKLKDAPLPANKIYHKASDTTSTGASAVGVIIDAPDWVSDAAFKEALKKPYATATYSWTRIVEKSIKDNAGVETGTETVRTALAETGASYTLTAADVNNGADVKENVKDIRIEVTGTVRINNSFMRGLYVYKSTAGSYGRPFKQATAYINFFGNSAQVRPSAYIATAATSEWAQTWWLKDLSSALALIGFGFFMIGGVLLLLKTGFFKSLLARPQEASEGAEDGSGIDADTEKTGSAADSADNTVVGARTGATAGGTAEAAPDQAPARPKSRIAQILYWAAFGLNIALSGVLFYVIANGMGGKSIFGNYVKAFPQPATNAVLVWSIVAAVIMVGLFALSIILNKVLNKEAADNAGFKERIRGWGIIDKPTNVLKGLLVAAIAVFAGFVALFFCQWMWGVDFRLLGAAVKTFERSTVWLSIWYALFFFLFFAAQSFVVNNTAGIFKKEIFNTLLGIAMSAGGMLVVCLIAGLSGRALTIDLAVQMIVLLGFSAVISRTLYKQTGKIWTGAFLSALLFAFVFCANTVTLL